MTGTTAAMDLLATREQKVSKDALVGRGETVTAAVMAHQAALAHMETMARTD